MAYIGNQPVPQATQTRDRFVATASQTSFATSGYTPGFLDVYLNGVKLDSTDYTASNGSDVVLASGATSGDIVEVVAFSAFESADHYSKTDSDTRYVNASGDTMTGNLIVDANIGVGTSSPAYKLETKDGDISVVKLAAASGGNTVNGMRFRVNNSSNTAQSATLGMVNAETVSNWGGVLTFSTKPANGTPDESVTERMRIDSSGRVTMPYQPSLLAQPDANGNVDLATGGTQSVFGWHASGGIRHNVGFTISGYSGGLTTKFNAANTGVITVPSAGRYLIYLNLRCESTSGAGDSAAGQMAVYVNGSWVMRRHTNHWGNDPYTHEEISAVLNLSANDYLSFGAWWNNTSPNIGSGFSGYNDKVNWLYIAKIS